MDRQDVKFSIRKKILGVTLVAALPFLAISIYLLISMSNYNHTYNKIVQNLTIANNYNLDFKDEMDESLYKMVVGYVTVDGFDDAEELKSPYVLIKDLRKEFRNLKKITTDTESKLWLDSLLRNIDTLEDRVDDLVQNIHVGGTYDINIKELDDNIYILTELIQDDIQYYIYYQTESMEKVTDTLNTQILDIYHYLCMSDRGSDHWSCYGSHADYNRHVASNPGVGTGGRKDFRRGSRCKGRCGFQG